MIERLVSGGQTGVDRAALDVALDAGTPCGGWCPKGRTAEDGPIPARYDLRETPCDDPEERTRWNVRDSDATLVICRLPPTGQLSPKRSFGFTQAGGTALAVDHARALGKPVLVVDPGDGVSQLALVRDWVHRHHIRMLNVAGPRESEQPGIYHATRALLDGLLAPSASGV